VLDPGGWEEVGPVRVPPLLGLDDADEPPAPGRGRDGIVAGVRGEQVDGRAGRDRAGVSDAVRRQGDQAAFLADEQSELEERQRHGRQERRARAIEVVHAAMLRHDPV
jgi:hypothetical protein